MFCVVFANMANLIRFSILLLHLAGFIIAVDKGNFKTCEQSSFCRRLRKITPDSPKYFLNLENLQLSDSSIETELVNTEDDVKLKFVLKTLADNTFRVIVDEYKPLHPRYHVDGALDVDPEEAKFELLNRNKDDVTIKLGNNKATLRSDPFKLEFYREDVLVAVVNSRNLFEFEHLRLRPTEPEGENEQTNKEDPGAWEENFKSHHDSKPRGPEAIGLDITFPDALRAYGLPEHADRLPLKTTGEGGLDPYRLYNLDVFEYELDSTMAIYGAIPVLYAHGLKHTVGVFWHNSAETWIDINNSKDINVVSSLVNLVSGNKAENRVDAHFMSESGIVDLFVFMGPTFADTVRQYTILTGTAPIPQIFSLGYHQCRWNYNDETDVVNVIDNFDQHDFPVDFIWLDIEYTDGKKYFTWDPIKFKHPVEMQQNLTATGRKLIVIIDPHIKRESGYFLHEDALSNDYYVKTKDGSVYEGWCWPGSSSYLDFFDPKVIEYYSDLYGLDKFPGSTNSMYIWNDMNEPSVFNGPEVTMPKDCLHYGGWEHRHIHNIHGYYYTKATFEGLIKRTPNTRPFILTRSFFAGSQRHTAMWTGDNAADWSHLAISFPMCLSVAISGFSFCGADIGGFFHNPDIELLQRWYQAGVWLPFYRSHAHLDTKRREPYLFEQDVQTRIRNALRLRYAHLPVWYTQFWEHSRTAEPVIRPLVYQYPTDANVLDIDFELLIGSSILVRPVVESKVSTVSVYFPGGASEIWYDIEDFRPYPGVGSSNIPVTLDKVPVYYRGGSIIPRKDRPRRSSSLMRDDPYTLYVVLGTKNYAAGTLYTDDGFSYDYKQNQYLYVQFKYKDNTLTSSIIDKDAHYPTREWIERVIIINPPKNIKHAEIKSKALGTLKLQTSYNGEERCLTIRKPGVSLQEEFTINLI